MISSKQSFFFPGLFTVEIPSNVRAYEVTKVILTPHVSDGLLSARRLSCGLVDGIMGYSKVPITCTKEGQFIITIFPFSTGDQELIIKLDGKKIYGSPFIVHVRGKTWFDKLKKKINYELLLGRHGSVSLCRDERENKMAATYNVLAFKR